MRYAFKVGEVAYQQNDNLSEMEEFKSLPEGFTPEVFGYLELTVFDLEVHVLIVEKVIPLRCLRQSWHRERWTPDTAAQATTCVVSCIRLMRNAADVHQLELSDWHLDNLGFSYPGSAAVLLDWAGTKKTPRMTPSALQKGLGQLFS